MRVKILFLWIFIFSFYFVGGSSAFAAPSCQNYFSGLDLSTLDTPYLKAVGRYATEKGHIIYYEEQGKPNLMEEGQRIDPHGFIHRNRIGLGDRVASFWGLTQAENYYSFPDIDFLNARVSDFNMKAPSSRSLAIKFELDRSMDFGDAEKKTSNNERYIERHAFGKVVIGESGWIRKHDENYHVLSQMLATHAMHIESQKKSLLLIQFKKRMLEVGYAPETVERFFESILKKRAEEIDLLGNAFVGYVFSGESREAYVEIMTSLPAPTFLDYVGGNRTASDYLMDAIMTSKDPDHIKYGVRFEARKFLLAMLDRRSYIRTDFENATEFELASRAYENFEYFKKLSERLEGGEPPLPQLDRPF